MAPSLDGRKECTRNLSACKLEVKLVVPTWVGKKEEKILHLSLQSECMYSINEQQLFSGRALRSLTAECDKHKFYQCTCMLENASPIEFLLVVQLLLTAGVLKVYNPRAHFL